MDFKNYKNYETVPEIVKKNKNNILYLKENGPDGLLPLIEENKKNIDKNTQDITTKQNKLIAGDNITIVGDTISASGGENINSSKVIDDSLSNPSEGINPLLNDISTNTIDIAANTIDIDGNTTDIRTNTNDINTNSLNIDTNTLNITSNKNDIDTNKNDIDINNSNIRANETAINKKQNKLIAGNNITIVGDTISATGGGGTGDATFKSGEKVKNVDYLGTSNQSAIATKQNKLIAGDNITITGDTISATGEVEKWEHISLTHEDGILRSNVYFNNFTKLYYKWYGETATGHKYNVNIEINDVDIFNLSDGTTEFYTFNLRGPYQVAKTVFHGNYIELLAAPTNQVIQWQKEAYNKFTLKNAVGVRKPNNKGANNEYKNKK